MKSPQSRWLDSICYCTMMGECYYQMGELEQALEQYNAAVRLYLKFDKWMLSVAFRPPSGRRPTCRRSPGARARGRRSREPIPQRSNIGQGGIDASQQLIYGGVVQMATLTPIGVQEIVRCTILAIRRRTELMGPLWQIDPTTPQLVASLTSSPGPPNHWSQTWVEVELAMALLASGRQTQAVSKSQPLDRARRAVRPSLHLDRTLGTGPLALLRGDTDTATQSFFEASISAVQYPDAGALEEALRYGALTHLVANHRGVYPPLIPAANGPSGSADAGLGAVPGRDLAVLGTDGLRPPRSSARPT